MSAAGGGGFVPRDEQTPKIPYNQSMSAALFLLQAAGVGIVFCSDACCGVGAGDGEDGGWCTVQRGRAGLGGRDKNFFKNKKSVESVGAGLGGSGSGC